ncbi:LRR receptor-like serine/threonine-protein kinase RGI2 [Linum perenne]
MAKKPFITLFIFLQTFFFTSHSLNQEGLSLLSWLSTFNSSSPSSSSISFSSWDQSHPTPCKWDFITCSGGDDFVAEIVVISVNLPTSFPTQILSFTKLRRLVLSRANLTGRIPGSISNLSNSLVELDLSFNSLTGGIPAEIGQLRNLQALSLNSNLLEGRIPGEIGNVSKLRKLELYDNRISGKIPAEIGELGFLEKFRAGGNSGIFGEIPPEISNCRSLVYLGLADTGISGRIPIGFGRLKNLKILSVYTARLSGSIPPELGNCSELESLFLYQNQLSGLIPRELGWLTKLRRLLLWQNNLTGSIPEVLGNVSGLEVIDLSINSLSGMIPSSFANLVYLSEFLLSENQISGTIPEFIGNFSGLKQLELDNNFFNGEVPYSIGKLSQLSLFYAWNNQLKGKIPEQLGNCVKLEALDLSHNFLTGSIPKSLFQLKNLSQLLLISNNMSGVIPPDIGNCHGLIRLRLGSNSFSGEIPPEIGILKNLSFLELSRNSFVGEIPQEIGNCTQLEMVDLHGNMIHGVIPETFEFLLKLTVLDLSRNRISGRIPHNIGKLTSLNKLILGGNYISGSVPYSLGFCKDLQLLDLGRNRIEGSIPFEIGQLEELDIMLNLSWNLLTGPVPESFSNLSKLSTLDISHNILTGTLTVLGRLENLVSLNVSFNRFSGSLPNTKIFQDLPLSCYSNNTDLCIGSGDCAAAKQRNRHSAKNLTRNIIIWVLLSLFITLLIIVLGFILFIRIHGPNSSCNEEANDQNWDFTPFQKLNFSLHDIVTSLSDANVIGKGGSGMVYRVQTSTNQIVAVKKLWPVRNSSERDFFSAEVRALGSIRHKNIVRLLGCCKNGKTRLLLFDYISHGSLAGLLHEKEEFLDWEARYRILLGAAHGLAYLHHDCTPPIVHRDVKANNILVGQHFEAFLADFGIAKLVDSSAECSSGVSNSVAGSYGYIAPEYGYSLRITEKSDVYSYGVVLLEILTGKQPTDSQIPEGAHIVNWVNKELREKRREFTTVLDQQLVIRSGTQLQEMVQVLGVALLCVNPSPGERPTMKDVAAMLKEIKDSSNDTDSEKSSCGRRVGSDAKGGVQCSSFSRSSEALIRSP